MSTLSSMSGCCVYIFVWLKCILPSSPEICDRPHATYSFLNESQAQIAHLCLEPELPGEEGKAGGGREEGGGKRERGEI